MSSTFNAHPSTPARVVIGWTAAGMPRTYRLVRKQGWARMLATELWSLVS